MKQIFFIGMIIILPLNIDSQKLSFSLEPRLRSDGGYKGNLKIDKKLKAVNYYYFSNNGIFHHFGIATVLSDNNSNLNDNTCEIYDHIRDDSNFWGSYTLKNDTIIAYINSKSLLSLRKTTETYLFKIQNDTTLILFDKITNKNSDSYNSDTLRFFKCENNLNFTNSATSENK